MDRCALFVDAGYLLGDGAMAVHGTRHRDAVSWDFGGVLQLLNDLSRERTGLPLLRCYWYEATVEGRRSLEHESLADLPGLKLRLGRIRPGRREGVDTEIHRDLMTLARNSALAEAVLVSGDEDLSQVVADAQDLGVRVTVVHVAVDGNWTISRVLRQECDDLIEIGAGHLRPYVNLLTGMDGTSSSGAPSVPASSSSSSSPSPVPSTGSTSSAPSHGSPISSPASGSVLPGVPIGSSAHSAPPVPSAQSPHSSASGASPLSNGHGNGAALGSLQPTSHNGPPPASPITGPPQGTASTGPSAMPSAPLGGQSATGRTPAPAPPSSAGFGTGGFGGSALDSGPHTGPGTGSSTGPNAGPGTGPLGGSPGGGALGSSTLGSGPSGSGGFGASFSGGGAAQPAAPAQTGTHAAPPQPAGQQYTAPPVPAPAPPSAPQAPLPANRPSGPYTGPQQLSPVPAQQQHAPSLAEAVKAAHQEGQDFGESVARDAPALWLEAVLARKPRMPSDLEARLLQGSSLPIDFLLHDEVRHALRRGFWDALERSRR
ncbi:NYN domain-containing protein [Actinomadura sp. WMMB 499]|uniref:NYN domain-containing protein n=1 Tax=Actinomadura sp. WMMB 499 TaxID=1219491 RepID=UPI0012472FC5|nr:NYN domain-containing protein [Actinomadura sp. WMMB 499]QFG23469.1 NYN domain-containing protein [Actinomadura sp. WMMB 499]